MTDTIRAILLARRPGAKIATSDLIATELAMPVPKEGEVLTRTLWLSLDPYMRGRMVDAESYRAPVAVGGIMEGETVGEVVASKHPDFQPGQIVLGAGGWATHLISPGEQLTVLNPGAPWQAHLSVLGMPGATAYAGLRDIGQPKEGETVVVSAAAGAVGSVAVQLAKQAGARVVGLAGGAKKCAWVTDALGADACIDYRSVENLSIALQSACPNGIDVYWENVGGATQAAIFPLLNDFGRVIMCGMISEYDGDVALGPNLMPVITKRLRIQGFIVIDRQDNVPVWRAKGAQMMAEGRLHYRDQVIEGLDNAPAALVDLFNGTTDAKLVVRVAEPSA